MIQPQERRDREIARTREDILHAAARAFARTGFRGTTMQHIATEAGYTVPTLYRYFESKEEIFEALMVSVAREIFTAVDEPAPQGLNLRQRVEWLLHRVLEIAERYRDAFKLCMSADAVAEFLAAHPGGVKMQLKGTDALLTSDHQGHMVFCDRLALWFREVAKPEELHGYDAEEASCLLTAIAIVYFDRWLESDTSERLADRTATIVKLFFEGVNGGKPTTAKGVSS